MNDSELYTKASQAARDYRTVHGVFPDKVGIHHKRLQSFPYRHIVFPEMTELPAVVFSLEEPSLESMTFRRHMVMFEPVIGEAIEWNEVYLPIPGKETKVISGQDIARFARAKEQVKVR